MSAGQKVSLHPINSGNGVAQMASQINKALGAVERAMNQRSTTQILYDTDHATARVLLGKVPNNREYLVAISKTGVDVLSALDKTRINEDDFIFHSGIINAQLERYKKLFELTTDALKEVDKLFDGVVNAFRQISSVEGMEGITIPNNTSLKNMVAEIEKLKDENIDPEPSV